MSRFVIRSKAEEFISFRVFLFGGYWSADLLGSEQVGRQEAGLVAGIGVCGNRR